MARIPCQPKTLLNHHVRVSEYPSFLMRIILTAIQKKDMIDERASVLVPLLLLHDSSKTFRHEYGLGINHSCNCEYRVSYAPPRDEMMQHPTDYNMCHEISEQNL